MAQTIDDAEKPKTVPTDPAQIAALALSAAEKTDEQPHLWRGRDVVFVDPLDALAPYWWPAMIVPTDEIDASMGCLSLGLGEYLVKYFEDCKYSTVNGSELRLFDTTKAPFTDFAAKTPQFIKDKAIKSAMWYLRSGFVHNKFRWRLWETGSETISLPFTLASQIAQTADADAGPGVAEAPAQDDRSQPDSPSHSPPTDTAAVAAAGQAEESDDSTLVTANLPDAEPTGKVPGAPLPDAEPSRDAVAADYDPGQQLNETGATDSDADADEETNNADAVPTRSLQPQTLAISSGASVVTTPAQSPPAHEQPQQGQQEQQEAAAVAESPALPSEEPTSAATAPSNDDGDGDGDGDAEDGSGEEAEEDNENEDENEDDNQDGNEDEDNDTHNHQQQQQQQQQKQQRTATPASTATARTTPETTTPPQQQEPAQPPQPQPRTRRARAQRVTANGSGGTGRRGRPPLSSKQGGAAKHKRNVNSSVSANGARKSTSGPTVITDSMSSLMEDSSVDSAYAAESQEIQAIVKEMEEVQEEYRFFRSLVKMAAKDLWTQMGNEWPPSASGASTRFGKRRKLA